MVVPAGVGHCNQSQSADLLIVGGYPDNAARPNIYHGNPGDHDQAAHEVAAVAMPNADPVAGPDEVEQLLTINDGIGCNASGHAPKDRSMGYCDIADMSMYSTSQRCPSGS